MNDLIDYYIIGIFTYFISKFIIDFINKRTYVKALLDDSITKDGSVYINLYDYKKNEILPRAVTKENSLLEEFRVNKYLILSVNLKEKIKYKYH